MTRWKVLWDTPDYHNERCQCNFCHDEYGIDNCDCDHCIKQLSPSGPTSTEGTICKSFGRELKHARRT